MPMCEKPVSKPALSADRTIALSVGGQLFAEAYNEHAAWYGEPLSEELYALTNGKPPGLAFENAANWCRTRKGITSETNPFAARADGVGAEADRYLAWGEKEWVRSRPKRADRQDRDEAHPEPAAATAPPVVGATGTEPAAGKDAKLNKESQACMLLKEYRFKKDPEEASPIHTLVLKESHIFCCDQGIDQVRRYFVKCYRRSALSVVSTQDSAVRGIHFR